MVYGGQWLRVQMRSANVTDVGMWRRRRVALMRSPRLGPPPSAAVPQLIRSVDPLCFEATKVVGSANGR